MNLRPVVACTILALSTATLVACSSPAPGSVSAITVDDATLFTYQPSGSTMEARITGPLGRDDSGCFTVDGYVVVVPDGARINSATSITMAEGTEYSEGDEVDGGGGASESQGPNRDLLDNHCGEDASFWYLNAL